MTPTARSLEFARRQGWLVDVVERWIAPARIRKDLFGCIDLVVLTDAGILGVQACAGASHAARREKALAEPRLRRWLEAGGAFEVWSWAKQGPRGERKVWTLRREPIELPVTAPAEATL